MKPIFGIMVLALALGGPLVAEDGFRSTAAGPQSPVAAPVKGVGYQLLDDMANLLMVPYGNEGEMQSRLETLMKQARAALESKEIPLPFYTRYVRMLGIFRLVTLPDPEGVVKPTRQAVVDEFRREIVGTEPGSDQLPHIAQAIGEEIVNLQLYLETLPQRQARLEALKNKFPPPPALSIPPVRNRRPAPSAGAAKKWLIGRSTPLAPNPDSPIMEP